MFFSNKPHNTPIIRPDNRFPIKPYIIPIDWAAVQGLKLSDYDKEPLSINISS